MRSRRAGSGCGRCSRSSAHRRTRPAPVAAGVAVELVHMATLVHDDLIDGAKVRRGKAAAWAAHGADAARATGDYLFARAFAELAAEGDVGAVAVLADACLCLARGEAMQRRPAARSGHDRRGVPRALLAEDGEAVRGGVLARLGRDARPLRPQPRDRVPDRGRHPRLLRRHDRDRQGRRHRPARGDADAAAAARGAGGRRRPGGARGRAGRGRADPGRGHRRARALAGRSRSTTLVGRGQASTAASTGRSSRPSPTLSSTGGAEP